MHFASSNVMTGVVVFSVAALIFAVLFYFAMRSQKSFQQKAESDFRETYGDSLIAMDSGAVYYGLASKGALQTHENPAVFALTRDRVRFFTQPGFLGGDCDLDIPLERLAGYEMSNTFVYPGVRYGEPGLLLLRFTDDAGVEDVLALSLPNTLTQVTSALEEHAPR